MLGLKRAKGFGNLRRVVKKGTLLKKHLTK